MSKTKPTQPPLQPAETDLPEGWAACPLGEVVSSVKGKKPATLAAEKRAGLIPYIDIRAFETGEYREFTSPDGAKVASEGDLLIVWDGARSGLVGRMPCEGAVGSTLAVLQPLLIDTDYLQRFLQANFDFINSNTRGTGIPHVDPEILWSIEFPIAPLVEQKRMVAKVEALLERVNAIRTRLAKLPGILKRFRQSVLAAASSGQLTAEWRNNSCAADESLPPSWQAKTVVDVCSAIVDCPHSTPKWTETGEICLRTTNFRPGRLDLTEVRYVSRETYAARIARLEPQPGDVLYSREGGILGIACIFPDGLRACLGQRMMLLRASQQVLPAYLMRLLNSPSTLAVVRELTGGTASPHINVGDVKAFPIPLPPLEEQREIVRRVEALFALADAVEAHIRAATVRAERLPQAILARAFRGELVPTEAELAAKQGRDYEPASVLLERIQEARKQHKPAKRGRGGKNMAKRSTGRQPARKTRPLDEVLREQGKPLTPERLFDLAGFDEGSVDGFYEQLRKLIQDGKVRQNRLNKKDVTLEAVGT